MGNNNTMHVLNGLRLRKEDIKEVGNLLHIEGYACHFGTTNMNGERVNEESFRSFFKILRDNGQMPVFNYNHQSNVVVGGWDDITADAKGLYVKGHINTDVAFVRDNLLPLVKGGDLNYLSTEGYVTDYVPEGDGYLAKEFILTAISLVHLPADMSAKIDVSNALELKRKKKKSGDSLAKNIYLTI